MARKRAYSRYSRPTQSRSQEKRDKWSTGRVLLIFTVAALVTLAAGVVLEESSTAIADHLGLSSVLFASTVLAAATALPEVATGLASVKIGDYTLAFSDIFGGKAFLPVLFLPATLLSGQEVLPQAKNTDIYLASLGASAAWFRADLSVRWYYVVGERSLLKDAEFRPFLRSLKAGSFSTPF